MGQTQGLFYGLTPPIEVQECEREHQAEARERGFGHGACCGLDEIATSPACELIAFHNGVIAWVRVGGCSY